jgi:hypothetical protein
MFYLKYNKYFQEHTAMHNFELSFLSTLSCVLKIFIQNNN